MAGKSADRYDSPNINDVIHRVPNTRPVIFPPGGVVNYFNTRPDIANNVFIMDPLLFPLFTFVF